jgi:hypothetical protein
MGKACSMLGKAEGERLLERPKSKCGDDNRMYPKTDRVGWYELD